jgi:hypothetical protein
MVFDKEFFQRHQRVLLWFANTRVGRYVLRIHGERSRVGKSRVSRILPHAIEWDNPDSTKTVEIRTHDKFAKRLYYAFKPVWMLIHAWDTLFANNYAPQYNLGFDTVTIFTQATAGTETGDAWIDHADPSDTLSFTDIRNAVGNSLNNSDANGPFAELLSSTSAADKYRALFRSLFTFQVAGLGEKDVVTSAVFEAYVTLKGANLGEDDFHLAGASPLDNSNFVATDYQRIGRTSFDSIAYDDFVFIQYYTWDFTPYYNKNNITGLSLQLGWDINNNFTGTWVGGTVRTVVEGSFADTGGTSQDPRIVITYTPFVALVPVVSNVKVLGVAEDGAVLIGKATQTNAPIIEQGFVVSTSPNPTVNNTKIYAEDFDEVFTAKVNGLAENTKYYARAFARNSAGLVYASSDLVFTTTAVQIGKEFWYKVYNGSNYVTTWTKEVLSTPRFRSQLNNIRSNLDVTLARSFDSFGTDIEVSRKVEVWVRDKERPGGKLLYTGYIASYEPQIKEDGMETVKVVLFPYEAEFGRFILQDESGNTTLSYTAKDPSEILTDIIDKYRRRGGTIRYLPQSIQRTNTQVTQEFKGVTIKDVLNSIEQLSPAGFYWYVDGKGILYFKQKGPVAVHNFAIGLDVTHLETFRRVEDLVNEVYFTGAGNPSLYRKYQNTSSIDEYGTYMKRITDNRIEEANSASSIANRNINAYKDPEIRSVFHIADSHTARFGYDIEDVQVGDTIQIKNQKGATVTPTYWDQADWDVDVWDQTITSASADVLQVHTLEYNEDKLVIMASSRLPQVSQRIEEIERKLIRKQTAD